ncbi:JmjC domain containing protein [Aphelenchoides avenae]|nr:JmjC domain containing protein [Aphelenchus avenae]
MNDSDEIVRTFRDDKRKKCPVYKLVEKPGTSLYEQILAFAAVTPKSFPMFMLRPEKGSSLLRHRSMDAAIELIPDQLEVKSYQLTSDDNDRGIYELDTDVVIMSKAEYAAEAKAQFSGDVSNSSVPDRFVRKKNGTNLAMLYAHDVAFSLMDRFDDIPVDYRLSSLNLASGFSSLLNGKVIEGVNSPMTYYSLTPSGSSWHEEDFGLASVNWLMPGSDTKFWIGKVVERQTELIRPIRKAYRHTCVNPLSHKNYLFSYDFFAGSKAYDERYYAEQEGGDIIVSMIASTHQVWNPGKSPSLAEAVNLLLPWWTKDARRMFRCTCDVFKEKYHTHTEWLVLRNALYYEEKAYFVRRLHAVGRLLRRGSLKGPVIKRKCAVSKKVDLAVSSKLQKLDRSLSRQQDDDTVQAEVLKEVHVARLNDLELVSVADRKASEYAKSLSTRFKPYQRYKHARQVARKRHEAKQPRGSSTARKEKMDPHLKKFGSQYDSAVKQLNRLRLLLQERPLDAVLSAKLEKQDLKVKQIGESRALYRAVKAHYDRVAKSVNFSDLQREGYSAITVIRDFWFSKSEGVRAYFAQLVNAFAPKSAKEDPNFAKFLTVIDVVLKVVKIEDPVNITSRKSGKDYVLININCADDRGDIVRINAWGKEIDSIQPRLVLNSLTKFEHLSAVEVLNPRYHVGPFKFVLSVQKETQATVLAENYVLKGLPLSKSSEINMTAFNRHRINCSITKDFVDHNTGMIGYGEMLQPDLRRTGIQLQIRLSEKAPLYRYSLVPGKVVVLSGSVGRKNQIIEMVVNTVADIEMGNSSSFSVAQGRSADKIFRADDLLQFTGPSGRAVVDGDVVGELVDIETARGPDYSLAIYVEDATGFTALTVHLEGLDDALKSSFVVGSRIRVGGTLQVMDGEVVLVAHAKEVTFNSEDGQGDSSVSVVEPEVQFFHAEDVLRMPEDSVYCRIRGVVVKHFEVEGKGATGVVMLMGKKNVAVKVQLSYDGASLVVDNVLRRAKLELEGTMLRDDALRYTMVTTDSSKLLVVDDFNTSSENSSPLTPRNSSQFEFGSGVKSHSSSSSMRTIDSTPTFLQVKTEPEDTYDLYGGGFNQTSTPKLPKGKRRQELRARFDDTEAPKKKITVYDLVDDEAADAYKSCESDSSDEENHAVGGS